MKKYDRKPFAGLLLPAAIVAAALPQVASAQDKGRGIEEVIVTAQRRDENIQDVPVAVTAATGDMLVDAHIANVENINALSPSITFRKTNMASSTSNIQIRGIGTVGNARTFEGAVGVFIDGVYRTRSGQALSNFLDIESLQVLRGPQGTLFGKNTSAGAVLLSSARPSTAGIEGNAELTYGNYNSYIARGAFNAPVSKTAAVRVAGIVSQSDGFIKDPNGGTQNDNKDYGLKAQLLLEPSDGLSFRLIGDYAKNTGNCCYGTVDAVNGPTQPLVDMLTALNGLKVPSHHIRDREAAINPAAKNRAEDYGASFYADIDAGPGTLHSVTALRRYKVFQLQDADFSGATIFDIDEKFDSRFLSQELTYNGTLGDGKANYVIGAFYSDEKLDMSRAIRWGSQAQTYWSVVLGGAGFPAELLALVDASPGLFDFEDMAGKARSAALFTHWDVKLSDRFNLIAGARFSNERKDGSMATEAYFRSPLFDPLSLLGVMPGIDYKDSSDNNAVSGTLGVQYRPSDSTMLYLSYNRGFKAGGVNLDANAAGLPGSPITGFPPVSASPEFKPETVDAVEAGAKLDWLDGRSRTNIAAFYNELHDLQVAQFLGLQFAIVNAPSAKVYGAELEQTFRLTDAVTLSADATWLPEAKFGESSILGSPLSGRRFPTAPKFAANFTVDGETQVGAGMALTGRVQLQYTDSVFTNTASDMKQDAVTLVNATIGLKSLNSGWRVELWGQNLTDETYVVQHFETPLQTGDKNAYLGAPRTYGITVRASF